MDRRFIESVNFPFKEISAASAIEKGPGRPPHWEMVFWWTRKPLISARAIIAGCLLPENTNAREFLYKIGIKTRNNRANGRISFETTPHRVKPYYHFEGVKLLDPFAGFGSIPLEGLRLGLDVTAVELLPVAYVFLKSILEYPAKYGRNLIRDVEKWGRWIIERLKEDPLIKELYEEDVAVYIGSWEIKCPHCQRWTPLIGNWWLARVKGDKGYTRLAWMEPFIENGEVKIRVIDLNKLLGDRAVKNAQVSKLKIKANGQEFIIPESNIEARREKVVCLHCHQPILQIDPQTGKHYIEKKNLPKEVADRLEGYVKYALKLYNKKIGGEGPLPPWLNETPARQRLLVKVKTIPGNLEFKPCTEKDQKKLDLARKEVDKMLKLGDPDVPVESLWSYSASGGGCLSIWIWGFDRFYKLFNSRQLLTLTKIVKLIREASKKIEEEKQKEGQTKEDAHRYAEAITTYLSVMLTKYVDHNTLGTHWHPVFLTIANTLAMRGITMMWNWTDENVLTRFTGSWIRNIEINIESLSYFTTCNFRESNSRAIHILQDDTTILNKIDLNKKFDLIVTDPPYYDDVPYAELSDFYYVWLKRALSDVEGSRLVPRFIPEVFFEMVGDGWVEVSTQWEKYALSEVSLNPSRLGADAKNENGIRHFQSLLSCSFTTMSSKLEDNGLLVTYYAHTDPRAWKALLEAGWEAAGLKVSNAFPITTESAQSVVSRGKLSMDTSIVVVWRKGCQGSIDISELYNIMIDESAKRARELMDAGSMGRDLVIGSLAASLAAATKYREIRDISKVEASELIEKYVYPATYSGLAKALALKAEMKESVKNPDAMFYLLVKSVLPGAKRKIIESTDLRLFSIGTSLDLNAAIKTWRLLKSDVEAGANVAKAKTYILIEPQSQERSKLAEILEFKGLNPDNPQLRCSLDALHLMEYYAVSYSRDEFIRRLEELKNNYPAFIEEARILARILARVLPKEDPEYGLCSRITELYSGQKLLFSEGGD